MSNLVQVECRKGDPALGPNLLEALLDFSPKGARLVVKSELTAGQRVEVLFRAAGLIRPLRCPGRVAWALALALGGWCVGVRFDRALAYADMQRLSQVAT
jgi:hypothetical protein